VPTIPRSPDYISSSDDDITLQPYRSEEDGGLPIADYELWMDSGSLDSSFTKLTTYIYTTHLFTFRVDRVANKMTKALNYRFKYRSKNVIGFSEFSDSTRVALGPLPAKPTPPTRSITGNSPTSIGLDWVALQSETLEVL